MKIKLVTLILLFPPIISYATNLTGAGSTFIYPVLSQWTQQYAKQTGIQINYQPIGSGGGIRQLKNKTIDFAASDMPLKPEELTKLNWQQFPMIIGGIVPIVNIKGIKQDQLVLSGKAISDIYLGHIKYWDDVAIKKLNPGLSLPHAMIITVHRADGSGTTFNFTNYLSKVSLEWKKKVGSNTMVMWPSFGLGAKGNAGVANQVMSIANSIGYVEYAYAEENQLDTVKMLNAAGHIVSPNNISFKAAAIHANWLSSKDYHLVLTNAPGKNSWPIDAATFILVPKMLSDVKRKSMQKFITWAFEQGGNMALKLAYVPIPKSVYQPILKNL